MFARPVRIIFLVAVAAAAGVASLPSQGTAAIVTGLAPQFSTWKLPLYTSHVTGTYTYAPTSYAIVTTDSEDHVIAWYRATLKGRATETHGRIRQLVVDAGTYVVNFEKVRGGTNINVIKN
jgi:hypothetical protein